jgi:hypothetical protein
MTGLKECIVTSKKKSLSLYNNDTFFIYTHQCTYIVLKKHFILLIWRPYPPRTHTHTYIYSHDDVVILGLALG